MRLHENPYYFSYPQRGTSFDLALDGHEGSVEMQALEPISVKKTRGKTTKAGPQASAGPALNWERAEDREITWIAVCSRAGARIFKKQYHDVELFHSLDFPLGRERTRALRNDKPSVSRMNFAAGGGSTHRMTGGKDPHEELAVAFSKTLGAYLKNAYQKKQFENLVIVAEPHFMGLIKLTLDKKIQTSVSQWVTKDLVRFSIFNVKKLFLSEKELKNIRFKNKAR